MDEHALPENRLQGHGVDGGPTAVLGGLLPRGLRRVRAPQQLDEDACDIEVEAELAEDEEPVEKQQDESVRVLCGLGGGKDSLVAWLLSTRQPRVASVDWLYVDDGGDEYENSKRLQGVVKTAGGAAYLAKHDFSGLAESTYRTPCGHPWAALCAFDGVATAALLGYDGFVVGHERSAAEGNGVFLTGAR